MSEPERKRRRPAVNGVCVYENFASQSIKPQSDSTAESSGAPQARQSLSGDQSSSPRKTLEVANHASSGVAINSPSASTISQLSLSEVDNLKSKIKELQDQLSNANLSSGQSHLSPANSDIESVSFSLGGTFHLHRRMAAAGQPEGIIRSISHKTRVFGQSHWITLIPFFDEAGELAESYLKTGDSPLLADFMKCKSLVPIIKAARQPEWPTLLSLELPPKSIADELLRSYLRTYETVFRILHLPTFRSDYESLWEAGGASPDTAFLVQVKLIFALGAVLYDSDFTMRKSAIRWVYEAQTWTSEPEFKTRLGTRYLQTELLLLFAREAVGVAADSVWVSVGALIRRAMTMGLHRDPSNLPPRNKLASEMRRRLWNTILEIAMHSSVLSGQPPSISMDDFDTAPPGNFNDQQLLVEDSQPEPESQFTEISTALAFRRTLPIRMSIIRFLNHALSENTYSETLRLDTELKAAHKAFRRSVLGGQKSAESSKPRFDIALVDYMMNHYLAVLHTPFFGLSLHETAYAFSRRVVVEASLKVWRILYPQPAVAMPAQNESQGLYTTDMGRLITCGYGLFRHIARQASLVVALELKRQIQEQDGFGPMVLLSEYFSVIEESKEWCLRCLEVGETNVKGYILLGLIASHIEGLRSGFDREGLSKAIVEGAEVVTRSSLQILEKLAAEAQPSRALGEPLQVAVGSPTGMMMLDWDFMMPDIIDTTIGTDQAGWIFDEEDDGKMLSSFGN